MIIYLDISNRPNFILGAISHTELCLQRQERNLLCVVQSIELVPISGLEDKKMVLPPNRSLR
jgi:hypothetical protein